MIQNIFKRRNTIGHALKILIAFVLFIGLVVGATTFLQHTLVIVKNFGNYAHWAVILIVIPLITGVVVRQFCFKRNGIFLFLGCTTSTTILFSLYKNIYWKHPPTYFDAFLYFIITICVAYLVTVKYFSLIGAY